MRIEKLSKEKSKKIILSIVLLLFIIGIIYITNSKAKYQVTKNVQIVNGNVNYSLADLNVLAMYKQKIEGNTDDSNYEPISNIPTSGYKLNTTKSYCTKPSTNDNKIKGNIIYDGESVSVNNITEKGTKCYLYFNISIDLTAEERIKDLGIKDKGTLTTEHFYKTSCKNGTNYNSTNCEEETNGVYNAEDDYGTSYYFRGSVNNNWIKFAGFYWRIIRINGDGTIRLIYSGKVGEETNLIFPNSNKKNPVNVGGEGTQIGVSSFNSSDSDNKYVGFMYGGSTTNEASSNYKDAHENLNSSIIKKKLDSWYEQNLKEYEEKIDKSAGFCGDRTPYKPGYNTIDFTNYGYSDKSTYFGTYYRLNSNQEETPTLKCINEWAKDTNISMFNDLYTHKDSIIGNKALKYPIGLITADEVAFAGGAYPSSHNYGFGLYTSRTYWTISPSYYSGGVHPRASVMAVIWDGRIYAPDADISTSYDVRPVINLRNDTKFTTISEEDKGTFSNPYEVK